MELAYTIENWHWLVLGLLLVGAETLGAGGFLIGLALAAFLQALLVSLVSISWEWQLVVYAFSSMLLSWVYFHFFRSFNEQTDQPQINDRAAQLVGRKLTLEEAVTQGRGRVLVGDTYWKVAADKDYPVGAVIEIVASEGMTLLITES